MADFSIFFICLHLQNHRFDYLFYVFIQGTFFCSTHRNRIPLISAAFSRRYFSAYSRKNILLFILFLSIFGTKAVHKYSIGIIWLNGIEFLGIYGKKGCNKGIFKRTREKGHKVETQIGFDIFDIYSQSLLYLFSIKKDIILCYLWIFNMISSIFATFDH